MARSRAGAKLSDKRCSQNCWECDQLLAGREGSKAIFDWRFGIFQQSAFSLDGGTGGKLADHSAETRSGNVKEISLTSLKKGERTASGRCFAIG